MPYITVNSGDFMSQTADLSSNAFSGPAYEDEVARSQRIRIKNRRKRYLDLHPDYFGPSLELADPLLYDQLIRRFQTAAEREAEGRLKGYAGILEADIVRSEAKLDAVHNPDPNSNMRYLGASSGEIIAEDKDEPPRNKQEAEEKWRYEMEMRFLRGEDDEFDYKSVDENEEWDDRGEEEREAQEVYFRGEQPTWVLEPGREPMGETGVQDF